MSRHTGLDPYDRFRWRGCRGFGVSHSVLFTPPPPLIQVVRLCAKSREDVSSPCEHLTLHYQVRGGGGGGRAGEERGEYSGS